jgi:serine/threonine protein kinase
MATVCFSTLAQGGNAMVLVGNIGSPGGGQWFVRKTPQRILELVPHSVFKVPFGSTESARESAIREHRILERLYHRNIVESRGVVKALFHCGTESADIAALVLPRADGSLYEIMETEDFRHVSDQLPRDLLQGLEQIHALGMIHGDVHLRNVLLFGRTWKLCDVEGAVTIGTEISCMAAGTPYMSRAPEVVKRIHEVEIAWTGQWAGKQAKTEAAAALQMLEDCPSLYDRARESITIAASPSMDMWGFGTSLYLVYGQTNWMGPSPNVGPDNWVHHPIHEELERIASAPAKSVLRSIGTRYGRPLKQLIGSCLEEGPTHRPSATTLLRLVSVAGG